MAISERSVYAAFRVSVVLKGANALLELATGVAATFVDPAMLRSLIAALVHHELIEDPNDPVVGALMRAAENYSVGEQRFATYYLISHGTLKLIVVAGLLGNRRWAYPAGLIILGLFILYQLYRMTYAPSLGLALLTGFDFVVLWLIWHEYRRVRRHQPVG